MPRSTDSKSHRSRDLLRVAAVQMKFEPTIAGNLAKIDKLVGNAARRGVDVALLPECATTGYGYDFARLTSDDIRDALTAVGEIAARHQVNVLAGSPVFRRSNLCNALVAYDRQGTITHCYAKCHLTDMDRLCFTPGNAVSLFEVEGTLATTFICHERRYPELVRLAVMAGARILFHPNAGMDALAVSKQKRGGRDGIVARAFENAVYYVFANSVGPQGDGRWSAGDSKIVGPDENVLSLADNRSESVIVADLDLAKATGVYAKRGLTEPPFLASHWNRMVAAVKGRAIRDTRAFDLP